MTCPHCKAAAPSTPVKYTWWGGAFGPKLLKMVKCSACGKGYNGATGQDNSNQIRIVMVIAVVLGVAGAWALIKL